MIDMESKSQLLNALLISTKETLERLKKIKQDIINKWFKETNLAVDPYILPYPNEKKLIVYADIPRDDFNKDGKIFFYIQMGIRGSFNMRLATAEVHYKASSRVHTIKNWHDRPITYPFLIDSDGNRLPTNQQYPCNPKAFPEDKIYKIKKPEWSGFNPRVFGPVKIRTDATQEVDSWCIIDKKAAANKKKAQDEAAEAVNTALEAQDAVELASDKSAAQKIAADAQSKADKLTSALAAAKAIEDDRTKYLSKIHPYLPFLAYVEDDDQHNYRYTWPATERRTTKTQIGDGYLIHYSPYADKSTLGCIGMHVSDDAIEFASIIDFFLDKNIEINLIVNSHGVLRE